MEKVFLSLAKKILPFIVKNYGKLRFLYLTKLRYRNDYIRLSIAYLYRIKLDNKYLLVASSRIPNQFQPVGGVYKFKPNAENIFNELKVLTDSGYNFDKELKDDLRIKVPGKNVGKFIDWFESEKDREINPIREFKEELVDTKILIPRTQFQNIDYKFIGRTIDPLKFSQHFECQEILIRDIYEFIPNPVQEKILRKTIDSETAEYRWFESEDIRRLGRTSDKKEYRVGQHAAYIM